jgi:hypothetical protein
MDKKAPKEEAEKLVALFGDKNDADFAVIIDLFAPKWQPVTTATATTTTSEQVDETALADAEVETDAALAVSVTNNDVEPLRKEMATCFAGILGYDTSENEE